MVASTIPKSPIYHGNRDAYEWLEKMGELMYKSYSHLLHQNA